MNSPIAVPSQSSPCDESGAYDGPYIVRALRTLSAGNRTLLRATNEESLLSEMCRVIVETGGYRIACVGYAIDDEQKTIRWMASVGTTVEKMAEFNFTWDDNDSSGSATGTAIRTGSAVVGKPLSDPSYAGARLSRLKEQAQLIGFSAFTALPLRVDDQVVGGLLIGAAEQDAFTDAEVKLLTDLADDIAYGIAVQRLRVDQRNAHATITQMAYYDTLTGLPNRALLLEKLNAAIHAAEQQQQTIALLHLEIERFHEINKVLGYSAGDDLLTEVAKRLTQCVECDAFLAKVGEAEFALVVPSYRLEEAVQLAKQLVHTLHPRVSTTGLLLDAQVGIGIALYPDHATEATVLVRRANATMHMTQPLTGGYAVFANGLEQEHTRRLMLMGDLQQAITNNELRLFCQPKVNIASKQIYGVEALVRWESPRHGNIPTSEFIKLAEQTGTITPLTHWMLTAAFSQSHRWNEAGTRCAVAINLSARDLYDPDLVDHVSHLFSVWNIAPELIQFELTESALISDPQIALDVLTRLRGLGVKLFIDDFGTGYSGLSYLQKLPIDAIKIDQSFIMPMAVNMDSKVIVRSTIELAHNLGMEVVAEGVESQDVWDSLHTLGCDAAQGYLISAPMPAEQFPAWRRQWIAADGH